MEGNEDTRRKQTPEHVEKRAAAMRGKKLAPRPRRTEKTPAEIAHLARLMAMPRVDCPNGCGGQFKQGGSLNMHLKRCGVKCAFGPCNIGTPGGRGYCGVHYTMYKNVKEYGLTVDTYLALYDSQSGKCAICGVFGMPKGHRLANGLGNKNSVLCIDHDHATGAVRGLLCHKCNVSIGHFNDDPAALRKAAGYLEANK